MGMKLLLSENDLNENVYDEIVSFIRSKASQGPRRRIMVWLGVQRIGDTWTLGNSR